MEGKKIWKKWLLLGSKWLWHKKNKGNKVLKHQTMLLSCPTCCTYFNISYFLFCIIIYTIFTIYDTFHSILSLNDARDITNFTTYVLQVGMSPITKKISNIYLIYFLSNTNHIFTPSVCKFFSRYELVIFVYLF